MAGRRYLGRRSPGDTSRAGAGTTADSHSDTTHARGRAAAKAHRGYRAVRKGAATSEPRPGLPGRHRSVDAYLEPGRQVRRGAGRGAGEVDLDRPRQERVHGD